MYQHQKILLLYHMIVQEKNMKKVSNSTDKLSQSDTELGSRVRLKEDEISEEENISPTNGRQIGEDKILVEPSSSQVKSFSLVSADEGNISMDKRDDVCNKGNLKYHKMFRLLA